MDELEQSGDNISHNFCHRWMIRRVGLGRSGFQCWDNVALHETHGHGMINLSKAGSQHG